jgi:hypothetical protein
MKIRTLKTLPVYTSEENIDYVHIVEISLEPIGLNTFLFLNFLSIYAYFCFIVFVDPGKKYVTSARWAKASTITVPFIQ